MRNLTRGLVVCALLALTCAGQSCAQNLVSSDTFATANSVLADAYGVTICYRGTAYSFERADLGYAELNIVRAHEAVHRKQATRYATCDAFYAVYRTPAGMLALEAEAYMTDICVAEAYGADPIEQRRDYAERLSRYFGGGEVNALEIRRAMAAADTVCPIKPADLLAADSAHTTIIMPGWTP